MIRLKLNCNIESIASTISVVVEVDMNLLLAGKIRKPDLTQAASDRK
jgi:hypothetical protein